MSPVAFTVTCGICGGEDSAMMAFPWSIVDKAQGAFSTPFDGEPFAAAAAPQWDLTWNNGAGRIELCQRHLDELEAHVRLWFRTAMEERARESRSG